KNVEGHLVDSSNTLIVFAPGQFAEEINIPSGITGIGLYVFRNALTVKKVNFPTSLETIGDEAFFNSGLEEVSLNKVKTIGQYAFGSCLSLTTITIPTSVTTIKDYAFQYCTYLKEVYINNTMENMGYGVFHAKEEGETMVYIEFTEIPETWSAGWDASSNVIYILGRYVKD
ncbi:MAG: leucine-rich repeat domain-containing protein, partial [Clostridia bacterium]|nr:leucine-rich repeat domain-containing protein [Clostridia bacterium]